MNRISSCLLLVIALLAGCQTSRSDTALAEFQAETHRLYRAGDVAPNDAIGALYFAGDAVPTDTIGTVYRRGGFGPASSSRIQRLR